MMSFDEFDGLKEKTKIIVNRVGLDAGQIGLKKAQETIGREIFWQIPNDYRTMVEVRNNGVPLLEQFPEGGHHSGRASRWRRRSPVRPSWAPSTKSSGFGGLAQFLGGSQVRPRNS